MLNIIIYKNRTVKIGSDNQRVMMQKIALHNV